MNLNHLWESIGLTVVIPFYLSVILLLWPIILTDRIRETWAISNMADDGWIILGILGEIAWIGLIFVKLSNLCY